MDRADPARQALEAHVAEPRGADTRGQRLRIGKVEHRLWQVGIGVPMFRHRAPDGREHAPEIEEVEGPERRGAWRGELEHHEARARLENAGRFPEAGIEVRKIADPECDHSAVEAGVAERQLERVGAHRARACGLSAAAHEHRHDEVRADHRTVKAGGTGQRRREIERSGAEIEITVRPASIPVEPRDRGAAPAAIHVEPQQMIEEVVARRDGVNMFPHIRPLRSAAARYGNLECGRRRHRRERWPSNLTGASDQDVVASAVRGHEAAFRELVRRYERPVFSLLYRMVRDRALAEDLAQETFMKVLNGLKSYRSEFKFSSWIFKVANNVAIDQLRKRGVDTVSMDGAPDATTPDARAASALQLRGHEETPLQKSKRASSAPRSSGHRPPAPGVPELYRTAHVEGHS